jgi:hypothetical protein
MLRFRNAEEAERRGMPTQKGIWRLAAELAAELSYHLVPPLPGDAYQESPALLSHSPGQ